MGSHTHVRKRARAHAHEHPPPPDLHLIKPPIFICVISQFQSNNQSDPGAAALAALGRGGREGEGGRQGGRSVHPPVCLRWQRPRVKTRDKHQGDAARRLKNEG